jgi:hypothetical protein
MPGPYFPGYVVKGSVADLSAVQDHELGRLTFDSGRILQYVKFGSGVARYHWVGLDITASAGVDAPNTVMILGPQGTHTPIGVAEYGGTASSYGWITRFGAATAKTSGSISVSCAGVPLSACSGVTGALNVPGSSTYMGLIRGSGIVVTIPNSTGLAHVNVNCL